MDWLNYHHLLYFWMVAKTGSITRASAELRLAQPTVSAQLRALEENFGEKLFTRVGRRLQLTEIGQVVYGYADEIFSLGRELTDVLKGKPRGRPARLVVGISDLIPKLVAYRILQPALTLSTAVHFVCYEDQSERLLLSLAAHELDLVLTDAPAHSAVRVRVFSHLLGSSDMALFAAPALATRYRKDFPARLDGAPFLMPMQNSASRRGPRSMVGYTWDTPIGRRRIPGSSLVECIRSSRSWHIRLAGRRRGPSTQILSCGIGGPIGHSQGRVLCDFSRAKD